MRFFDSQTLDSDAVVALIESTVTTNYIEGPQCFDDDVVTVTILNDTIASLSGLQDDIDAKVDKIGGVLGTPWIKLQAAGGSNVNPSITPIDLGSGERGLELAGNVVSFNPAYAVRFVKKVVQWVQGIEWDLAGLTMAFLGVGVWSVTTSNTNVKIVDAGVGKDMVLKTYDGTKSIVAKAQTTMTAPIFVVRRSNDAVTAQFNDVDQISAATLTTFDDLKAALVTIGILKA